MRFYELFSVLIVLLLCGCQDAYIEASVSMEPTIKKGDTVIVDPKFYSSASDVKRWNLIAYKFTPVEGQETIFLKRVIGLPNEKISFSKNKIFINSKELIIPDNVPIDPNTILRNDFYISPARPSMKVPNKSFFVLGDNVIKSADSRTYGVVKFQDIIGPLTEIIRKDGTVILQAVHRE